MNRRPARLWVTTAIWFVVAGGLWAGFEYQLRNGTEISLKAVPVDPRDILRGDFVTLRYEISRPPAELAAESFGRNATVYVAIEKTGEEWRARAVRSNPPDDGLFLRGRSRPGSGPALEIDYGIESYFVAEGEGKKYEDARNRERLWAVVSVSPHGVARLKRLEIR